jgi:tetratricopeptide (TPR) repeat protein
MGDAHQMLGQMEHAIQYYKMALTENAFDATIHFKIARAYEHRGRFDEAMSSYNQALKLDRNMQKASSALRIMLAKKEVFEQSRALYDMSRLHNQGQSADALFGEAIMMRLSGEPKIAMALLRNALEKEPTHFGANLTLGRMLVETGNDEEALANFSVAFAERPDSALAAYELAVTELNLGETRAAERWAAKAYELDSSILYEEFYKEVSRRAAHELQGT